MKKTLWILLATASVTTSVFAQRPGGERDQRHGFDRQGPRPGGLEQKVIERIMDNPELVKKLGLSDEQVTVLRNGVYDLRKKRVKVRAELELAAIEQARILTEPEINEESLMAAVERTGQVRTELAKLQMRSLLLVHQTLDEEQRQKVRQFVKGQFRRHMRDRRPAGSDRKRDFEGRGRDRGEGPRGPAPGDEE